MTAAHAPVTYVNAIDTENSAREVQNWIIRAHLTLMAGEFCACWICTHYTLGEHHD